MRCGFLIPTAEEAQGVSPEAADYAVWGYGAGKAAACAMAADLIYGKGCDTVVIWGTAGGISARAVQGQLFIADQVAYGDYDVRPLYGSTGVGFVHDFTDREGWYALEHDFTSWLEAAVRQVFPQCPPLHGRICSNDRFSMPADPRDYNRIEAAADAVDMESAAVAEFIHRLNARHDRQIRLGVLRVVSNAVGATEQTGLDFTAFLETFCALNGRLAQLKHWLEGN